MLLKTLIADDEEPSRARLLRLLKKYPRLEVVAQAASGSQVLQAYKKERPQLLFLDIQMPPPDGLEVCAELMDEADPPLVVFLTAFSEHAVEAFELSALDYLTKPVKPDRLKKTIERVEQAARDRWDQAAQPRPPQSTTIAVKDEISEGRILLDFDEIEYFSTRDEQCFARARQREYDVPGTLTSLSELLPSDRFLRTHRAYLVNLQRVREVHPWFHRSFNLKMQDGSEVPLSRAYAPAFRQRVNWL